MMPNHKVSIFRPSNFRPTLLVTNQIEDICNNFGWIIYPFGSSKWEFLCRCVVMIVGCKGLALWKAWIYLVLEDLVCSKVRKSNSLSMLLFSLQQKVGYNLGTILKSKGPWLVVVKHTNEVHVLALVFFSLYLFVGVLGMGLKLNKLSLVFSLWIL